MQHAMRRADKLMPQSRVHELLAAGFFAYGRLYAIALERVVGKETALPAPEARWPAVDKTKSPSATPPRDT
jgi:hypothetical protein